METTSECKKQTLARAEISGGHLVCVLVSTLMTSSAAEDGGKMSALVDCEKEKQGEEEKGGEWWGGE